MKFRVKNIKGEKDKCCVLWFGEMSLQPGLLYSKHEDVVGFTDGSTTKKTTCWPCISIDAKRCMKKFLQISTHCFEGIFCAI